MKRRLGALALLLALLLVPALTACSTTQSQVNAYNATQYVQGVLDETYAGEASEVYLQLMGTTAEKVAETCRANLESEYLDRLARRFELEDKYISKELREDFYDLLRQVYAKADWTVHTAVPLDHARFCVEVTVVPVTFFAAAYADGYAAMAKEFAKTHNRPTEEALANMSASQADRAVKQYEAAWAQAVYDYLYGRLEAVTSGGAVTKLVLVSPDSHGQYAVSRTDLQDIDDWILQY